MELSDRVFNLWEELMDRKKFSVTLSFLLLLFSFYVRRLLFSEDRFIRRISTEFMEILRTFPRWIHPFPF